MGEAKPTKGEWVFCGEGDWTISVDGESVMGDTTYYPWVPSNKADWLLFVDAGNTYNTTGLTPSQLVERVKELEETLRSLHERFHSCSVAGTSAEEAYDSFYQFGVADVLSKARPNIAEGE